MHLSARGRAPDPSGYEGGGTRRSQPRSSSSKLPLKNPALLSFGKQPALKHCLYFPEDSELPARLAHADSLRRVPQLQHLILVWWDGHSSHPVPSTAGTHEAGSSTPPAPEENWLPANPCAFLSALPAFPTYVPLRWSEAAA